MEAALPIWQFFFLQVFPVFMGNFAENIASIFGNVWYFRLFEQSNEKVLVNTTIIFPRKLDRKHKFYLGYRI